MTEREVIKLLKRLDIHCSYSEYRVRSLVENNNLDEELIVSDGVSKICLVFKNENFVVKWSRYNDEAEREVQLYQLAKEANIEMFFPVTKQLVTLNNIVFVIQEKVDVYCCDASPKLEHLYATKAKTVSDRIISKMSNAMMKAHNNYARRPNELWVRLSISIYGKHRCKKFCEFVKTHKINDLHGGNLGYKNNKPVVLDFCGFENDSY